MDCSSTITGGQIEDVICSNDVQHQDDDIDVDQCHVHEDEDDDNKVFLVGVLEDFVGLDCAPNNRQLLSAILHRHRIQKQPFGKAILDVSCSVGKALNLPAWKIKFHAKGLHVLWQSNLLHFEFYKCILFI